MKQYIVFLAAFALYFYSFSQNLKIGDWAMHLNYTNINVVINENNTLYAGTKSGLFLFNEIDNSLTSFSKLDGLSSINITALHYNDGQLIVGYNDGNIDLITNWEIVNISDIASASILGDKKINNIFVDNNLAYVSCPFGIVVIDLGNKEVKETYYLSNDGTITEVFGVHVFDENIHTNTDIFLSNKIFAATNKGLFYASKNDNLLDYAVWQNDCQVSLLSKSNQYIYTLENTNVLKVQGFDKKEDGGKGLMIITDLDYANTLVPSTWSSSAEYNLFEINNHNASSVLNPNVFTVNTGVPGDIISIQYSPENQKSIIISNDNYTEKIILLNEFSENILSVNCDEIDKKNNSLSFESATLSHNYNNSKKIFLGDVKQGVVLAENTNNYNIKAMEYIAPNGPAGINIGSIDNNGQNLVFTHGGKTQPWNNLYNYQEVSFLESNHWSKSKELINLNIHDALAVSRGFTPNQFFVGTWNNGLLEFFRDSLVNHYNSENTNNVIESIAGSNDIRIGGIDVDQDNVLWLTNSQTNRPLVKFSNNTWEAFNVPGLPTSSMAGKIMCASNNQKWIQIRDNGILVAKEQGKGVVSKKLNTSNGLASGTVNCFTEDHSQSIWVGTNQGLSVFYFPDEIFNNSSYSAEYILIETEDGYVERLFNNTEILDIAVDGGNRKWIGTKTNGVFLISEDGTSQIYNFTAENSPLLDNTVEAISINSLSGEVFFATAKGLCSYRSNATVSNDAFTDVVVFPNPVRKNYSGNIAITGLSDKTNVKITDISGNLVFETQSVGGTALWNGTNFDGADVSTGVYLFLCTSADFETSIVKKVLIYN